MNLKTSKKLAHENYKRNPSLLTTVVIGDFMSDISKAEFEVLNALWEGYPASASDIIARLNSKIAALQKWKYKPQIIGGQAQIQHNLLVQLDYRLGENPSPIRPLIETVKILQ
tara:strand:- start:717 stop:1055 length:339 start_codon:yes stop_codon:yes gene_type:complete